MRTTPVHSYEKATEQKERLTRVVAVALAFMLAIPLALTYAPTKAYAAGSSSNITAGVVESNAALIYIMARYANADSLEVINATAKRLAPGTGDTTSEATQIARAYGLTELMNAAAYDSSFTSEDLAEQFNNLNGAPATNPSPAVQAATIEALEENLESLVLSNENTADLTTALRIAASPIANTESDEVQIARCKLIPELFDIVISNAADDPDSANAIIENFNQLLGGPTKSPSAAVQAAAAECYGAVVAQGINAGWTKEQIKEFFTLTAPSVSDWSSEAAQAGRARAVGDFLVGSAGWSGGTVFENAIDVFVALTGEKTDAPSLTVQVAAAEGSALYIQALARTNGNSAIQNAYARLMPTITDKTAEDVQRARAQALAAYYEAIARTPEDRDQLHAIFLDIYGAASNSPSITVQAAAAESCAAYFTALARQPGFAEMLTDDAKELSPTITSKDNATVAAACASGARTLIEGAARQPEAIDLLKQGGEEIGLLPLVKTDHSLFQGARAAALGNLYTALSRQPEMADTLTDLFVEIYGEVPTYTVTFDAQDGSEPTVVSVKLNASVAEPADPVRTGYTFNGWALNGSAFDFATLIDSDLTLAAQWTTNTPTEPESPTDPNDPDSGNETTPDQGSDADTSTSALAKTGDSSVAFVSSAAAIAALALIVSFAVTRRLRGIGRK
ncbi:MAG: InlB B-repeat-containing protein [Eggerthellaceae bacterium]